MSKDKAKQTEAPQEGAEGVDGEAPAKKKPKLMVLIIAGVAALGVLGGGGAGAYFMFLKPKPAEAHGEEAKKPKKKKKEDHGGKPDPNAPVVKEGPDGVVFYTLPDILVDLQSGEGGRLSHLKLKLTLELPNEEVAEELTPDMPRMNDMFQTFLRELRPEDLSGSQGSYQLRMEILRRVNLLAAPNKVNAVLIEEMLVQ
ncbi:MAG: flagellar basal body protein FliL [Caulobacteraceae bacterium]|nr:flagellar basal body-associated FliL family protein [Caulobacter sp.]RYF95093.1 MAG: flagellar basal body protein FliL [Caulobacteraceae bacterium]